MLAYGSSGIETVVCEKESHGAPVPSWHMFFCQFFWWLSPQNPQTILEHLNKSGVLFSVVKSTNLGLRNQVFHNLKHEKNAEKDGFLPKPSSLVFWHPKRFQSSAKGGAVEKGRSNVACLGHPSSVGFSLWIQEPSGRGGFLKVRFWQKWSTVWWKLTPTHQLIWIIFQNFIG